MKVAGVLIVWIGCFALCLMLLKVKYLEFNFPDPFSSDRVILLDGTRATVTLELISLSVWPF